MRTRASHLAVAALLAVAGLPAALFVGGSSAIAQEGGDHDPCGQAFCPGAPYPGEVIIRRSYPPSPGWAGPGWDPNWGWSPGWVGPGVGIYVDPPAPRYRPRYHTRRITDPHVEWCYSQYRSYREWDNSWQPYRGPRRECISPYY